MEGQILAYGTALGWTILHSLWQIILIAILLKGLLLITSNRSAELRYGLGLTAMLATLIWTGSTLWQEFNKVELIAPQADATLAGLAEMISLNTIFEQPLPELSALEVWQQRLEQLAPFMSMAWLIGVLFFSIYTIKGYFDLRRLQYYYSQPVSDEWQQRLVVLCQKLGISKKVELLSSNQLEEPITFRHFKPIILVPISALSGLSPDQIEVLLLHELAHIRRHDYLINWLQSSLEVLFFYHPAIWWMSAQVRTEREHCCDDLVLKVNHNPMLYAQALTQLQMNHYSLKTNLAMSATKNQGTFTTRIHRLFGKYQSQTINRRSIVTVILVAFGLAAWAFYQPIQNPTLEGTSIHMNDTIPPAEVILEEVVQIDTVFDDNGNIMTIDVRGAEVEILEDLELLLDESIQYHIRAKLNENGDWELNHLTPNNTLENIALEKLQFEKMEYLFEGLDEIGKYDDIEVKFIEATDGQVDTFINIRGANIIDDKVSEEIQLSIENTELPSYVIDGKVSHLSGRDELEKIDPDKIQSISVIKGDEAIEAYGELGKNGVIEVTTINHNDLSKVKLIGEASSTKNKKDTLPLLVLDGRKLNETSFETLDIDPSDIESVTVYKREKAIEKYGKKWEKRGVVEIITKRPKKYKKKFEDQRRSSLEVFQDPVREIIRFEIDFAENSSGTWEVFDPNGEKVKIGFDDLKNSSTKDRGAMTWEWSTKGEMAGTYTTTLEANGQLLTKQFVIGKPTSSAGTKATLDVIPNPQDNEVRLVMNIKGYAKVTLSILNKSGEVVKTFHGKSFSAERFKGNANLKWDTKGQPAGKYTAVLTADEKRIEKQFVLGGSGIAATIDTIPENKTKVKLFMTNADAEEDFEYKVKVKQAAGKKPLYVIDREIEKSKKMEQLNPSDIARINVLKGTAAIEKYGQQGANGVIEVTTKDAASEDDDRAFVEIIKDKNPDAKSSFTVFPNPASDFVQMKLQLAKQANINLSIFDNNGKKVKTIIQGNQEGNFNLEWDATKASKGIYNAVLEVDGFNVMTKRIVIE